MPAVLVIPSSLSHHAHCIIPSPSPSCRPPPSSSSSPLSSGGSGKRHWKERQKGRPIVTRERHHMVLPQVPGNVLNQAATREEFGKNWDEYDRWDCLSEEFIRKWGSYRAPPPSYGVRFLRWVCEFDLAHKIVRNIRRILRIH